MLLLSGAETRFVLRKPMEYIIRQRKGFIETFSNKKLIFCWRSTSKHVIQAIPY